MVVVNNYIIFSQQTEIKTKIESLCSASRHQHTEYINTHAWTGAAGLELPVCSCFMSLALEIVSTDKRTDGYSLMHVFSFSTKNVFSLFSGWTNETVNSVH